MDIGQPGTGHARLQVRQPFFGNIERVNTAFVRHLRAHRQRFAARARAEIHHDFAALGLYQLRQKLAAFVLHFQRAVQKQRVFVQCGLVAETDAVRRIRRGGGVRKFGLQLGQHFVAAAFERVHARVQRCRLHHAAAERQHLFVRPMRLQTLHQPFRQLGGSVQAALPFGFARFQAAHKFHGFLVRQMCQLRQVRAAPQHQRRQCRFFRLRIRAAQHSGDFLVMAQGGKCRFGNFVAVLAAEFAVLAEIIGQHRVCRLLERQHIGKHLRGMFQLGGIHHGRTG